MKKIFVLLVGLYVCNIGFSQTVKLTLKIDEHDDNYETTGIKDYQLVFSNDEIKCNYIGDTLSIIAKNVYLKFAVRLLPISQQVKGKLDEGFAGNINWDLAIPQCFPINVIYLAGDDTNQMFDNFSVYYDINLERKNNILSGFIKFVWLGDSEDKKNLLEIRNLEVKR